LQIRAVFSKGEWREEEKGGGPAMESQGTGAGGEARRRGGAILVNKTKNIELRLATLRVMRDKS
jgi:hypothetical protein